MAINYHKYSLKRKAITQQVRRVEQAGFKAKVQYHLPTVRELKALPIERQRQIVKSTAGMTTTAVRKSAMAKAGTLTKTGKLKQKTVRYTEEISARRKASAKKGAKTRRKWKERVERTVKAEEYKRNYGSYPAWYEQDIAKGTAIGQTGSEKRAGELTEAEKQARLEGRDVLFEKYAQDFIDSAPLSDKANAEAYIQEQREGNDVGSYEEFLANLGEEPTAKETFDLKLDNLDQVSPETADYMREFYNRILLQIGDEEMNMRFANAKEIPDFDTPYETKTGGHTVGYGGVANMLSIIKGRPISGAEARALGRAMEKDEDL